MTKEDELRAIINNTLRKTTTEEQKTLLSSILDQIPSVVQNVNIPIRGKKIYKSIKRATCF